MNGVKKEHLVTNLCKLSASLCSYSGQPCDCKYMTKDGSVAFGSEKGSGCPEITMAAMLLAHMTEQEFLSLAKRAGINIDDDEDFKIMNVRDLIKTFQIERKEKILEPFKTKKMNSNKITSGVK